MLAVKVRKWAAAPGLKDYGGATVSLPAKKLSQ